MIRSQLFMSCSAIFWFGSGRWLVTGLPHNAHAGIDVDAQRFLELLVERISTLP